MEMIKKAVESLIEWVGILGTITILVISVTVWTYYDISEQHSRLTTQETVGLFLFALLIVSAVKALYMVVKKLKKGPADE